MKKITLSKIVVGAAITAISISTAFAQTNIGSECGCPALGSRAPVTMSTLPGVTAGELTVNTTLTCDKVYTLDSKFYVASGVTLTIQPGTVIKGASALDPANATALIIERGGKISADGTQACPIVFTSVADPMDGSYSLTNVGDWGGIVILGKATNNLTTANVYGTGTGVNGTGFVEGFSSANPKDLYGGGLTPDDNDNSGILRYVSIRHAGAILALGNELNGLSLGSVGRGTTIEHIETIASADDNIEFFGGTVNVKYASVLFGDDDFFDWDLGWKGKAQFLFGIASDSITGLHTTDNGFEADADDDKKNVSPLSLKSHPVIYNVTLIGNGHINPTADNSGPAAIQAKESTEGEIYNSVFANFRSGLHLATGRSNATNLGDAYDNWTATPNTAMTYSVPGSLIVKNNTFIGFGSNPVKDFYITKGSMTQNSTTLLPGSTSKFVQKYKDATAASAADITQFTTTDGNSVVASVPGIDFSWAWNSAAHTSYSSNSFHATPTANIASSITAPADGFFSAVNYRGAFDASKGSWLSEWALGQVLTSQQSNPTDLNNDGVTNVTDYLILVGKFGQTNSK
jgi:hypothetical protein